MIFQFFFIFFFINTSLFEYGLAFRKIKLIDIKELSLYSYKYTTGYKPIPQLSCSNYKLCQSYAPSFVKCFNQGHYGSDVQWKCEATLSTKVKFGNIVVSCEGYSYPNDPYVIEDSCGLKYSLEYNSGYEPDTNNSKIPLFPFYVIMVFIIIFSFFFVVLAFKKKSKPNDTFNIPCTSQSSYNKEPIYYIEKKSSSNTSSKNCSPDSSYSSNNSFNSSYKKSSSSSDNSQKFEKSYTAVGFGGTERR